MASIAGQLIFHPKVNQSIQLGSSTLARDKLYRAVQYFARFYAWWLLSKDYKEQAVRWNNLKAHLGTARKLLRLGKPVEFLQAILRTTFASGPPAECITLLAKSIAYFGFLSLDTLVWAQSIKFLNLAPATAQKVAKRSNQFWFAGILLSIVNSIAKGSRLVKEERALSAAKSRSEKDLAQEAEHEARVRTIKAARLSLRDQLTTDILDIWIPATGAGLVTVNEGILGVFGFVTSILALQKQWRAVGVAK